MIKKCTQAMCFGILALGVAVVMPGSAQARAGVGVENPLILADNDKGRGLDKDKIREMKEHRDDWKKDAQKRHGDRKDLEKGKRKEMKDRRDEFKDENKKRFKDQKERRDEWRERKGQDRGRPDGGRKDGGRRFDMRDGDHRPDMKPDGAPRPKGDHIPDFRPDGQHPPARP